MQITQKRTLRLAAVVVFLTAAWIYVHSTVAVPLTFYETSIDTDTKLSMTISGEALDALINEFPKRTYFAAFAAHADGHFGWVSGRHSLNDAQREALERCNRGGSGCVLQATMFPKSYSPKYVGNTVSGRAVAKNIATYLPVQGSLWYALSPSGAWAVQTGKDGGLFAPYRVWNRCETFRKDTKRPMYHSQNQCRLFYGPAYSVKKPSPEV